VATEPILKLIAVQLEDRDYPEAEMRDAQVRWLGLLRGGLPPRKCTATAGNLVRFGQTFTVSLNPPTFPGLKIFIGQAMPGLSKTPATAATTNTRINNPLRTQI
jgi:hypothetical protein